MDLPCKVASWGPTDHGTSGDEKIHLGRQLNKIYPFFFSLAIDNLTTNIQDNIPRCMFFANVSLIVKQETNKMIQQFKVKIKQI